MEGFKNKVLAQIAPVDPALANELLAAAQEIIDSLQGPASSAMSLKITSIGTGNRGKPRLTIKGVAGRVHIVEFSTDLVTWNKVGVAQPRSGNDYEFQDEGSDSKGVRFYRVTSPK